MNRYELACWLCTAGALGTAVVAVVFEAHWIAVLTCFASTVWCGRCAVKVRSRKFEEA